MKVLLQKLKKQNNILVKKILGRNKTFHINFKNLLECARSNIRNAAPKKRDNINVPMSRKKVQRFASRCCTSKC